MTTICSVMIGAILYTAMLINTALSQTQYCDSALVMQLPYGNKNELSFAGDTLWWLSSDESLRLISLSNHMSRIVNMDSMIYEDEGMSLDLSDMVFFNDSVGVIVGWKVKGSAGIEAMALRTINRGKTWAKTLLPVNVPIYSIDATANGVALAVGGSGTVIGTEDFGVTWQIVCKIDNFGSIASINLSADGRCAIGGYDNSLAISANFGKICTKIPTPADQLKRIGRGKVVQQIGIFADYVLAKQGDKCFYSRRDSILWTPIEYDAELFAVSDDENKFLIASRSAKIFIVDSNFTFDSGPIEIASSNIIAATSYMDRFFLMNDVGGIYSVSDSGIAYAGPPSVREQANARDMKSIRNSAGILFGVHGASIYVSEDWGQSWCRKWDATAEIQNYIPIDAQRVAVFYKFIPGGVVIDEHGRKFQIEGLSDFYIEKIIENKEYIAAYGRKCIADCLQTHDSLGQFADVFLRSVDKGLSWTVIGQDTNASVLDVFADATGRFWVFTKSELREFNVSNGVKNQRRDFSVIYPDNVSRTVRNLEIAMFCDSIGYGIASRGYHDIFLETMDGGRTWSEIDWRIFPFAKFLSVPLGLVYVSYDKKQVFFVDYLQCDPSLIFDADSVENVNQYMIYNITPNDMGDILIDIRSNQWPQQVRFALFDSNTRKIRYIK